MENQGFNHRKKIVVEPSIPKRIKRDRPKRFHRASEPKPLQLTDRDLSVLKALALHRYLSSEQLRRLVFRCGGSTVRRRLRALYDNALVERVRIVAQPEVGVPPFVYSLAAGGREVLAENGLPVGELQSTGQGLRFMRHRLTVNDFFIGIVEATRGTKYRIRNWRHEQQLKLRCEDGRGKVEQVKHPQLSSPKPLLPDAFFELDLGNGSTFAFFLEVDMATHAQRVWRERAQLYTAYADPQTGLFRRRFGRQTFRLLIVAPPDFRRRSRCDNILRSIQQTIGNSHLFLAITTDDLIADRLLGRIWHKPGSEELISIVESSRTETPARLRPVRVASTTNQEPIIRTATR